MKTLIIAAILCGMLTVAHAHAEDSLAFISRTMLTDYPWGVAKRGNYLYVPNRGTISIVDVSDPDNPMFVKNHNNGGGGAMGVFIVDTIMFCMGGVSFTVMNITDPTNPINIYWKYIGGTSENPFGIFVKENKCYLTRASFGFLIYDVTNPALPESVGSYNTPNGCEALIVCDSLAYIADFESLQVINIKQPESPFRVGAASIHWGFKGVSVHDNKSFCATRGDWGTDGRIVAVDVRDPANPVKMDSVYTIMGNPITAYYANGRIYSIAADYFAKKGRGEALPIGCKEKADVEGGVRVINVAKPDSIFYTCGYNTLNDPRDAIADSQYVYIADQDSGLIILRHNHYTGVSGRPNEVNLAGKMRLSLSPNPTTGCFTIQYTVPEPGKATIGIYNMAGQLVRSLVEEHRKAGKYSILWNGKNDAGHSLSAGSYLCRYSLNGRNMIQKAIIIR